MVLLGLVFTGSLAALLDPVKNQRLFVREELRKFCGMRQSPLGQAGDRA
jgi:hypothetical protein